MERASPTQKPGVKGIGLPRTRRSGNRGESGARWRKSLGALGLLGLGASSLAIVAGAQSGLDVLVPAAKLDYPGWLHGPLEPLELDLTNDGLAWLLLALCASYLLVLAAGDRLPRTPTLAAIAGLHLLYVLAPPLLSSDVFGYVDLSRLAAVHEIDPYSSADTPLPDDDVYAYRRWGSDLPAPYGPLFIAGIYPLGFLGVPGAFWTLKALLGAASLGIVALTHRAARDRGIDPTKAAAFVGLNPILLAWGVGGAHNDFLFVLLLMGAITTQRERVGAAALTAGAAIKASAGLPLLFMLAGARERRDALRGVAIAAAALLALTAAAFGTDAVRLLDAIRDQQDDVALFSFPNQLGDWLGYGGITDGIRIASLVVLFTGLAALLAQTARRRLDWVSGAAWATALLLVTTAWLLPWYLVWLLPLAAIADDRRLKAAAVAVGAFVVYTRVDLWFVLA